MPPPMRILGKNKAIETTHFKTFGNAPILGSFQPA